MASDWGEDETLRSDLEKYVKQGMQRKEILDFMTRDYPCYKWSLRTLDRRLRNFSIYYTDKTVSFQEAQDTILKELNGPGRLLGYRAMHIKLRQKYNLKLPRDVVYDLMTENDPDGLNDRRPGFKKKRKRNILLQKGQIGSCLLTGMIN